MLGRKMSLVGGDHSLLAADFNDDMVKERSSETDWINKYVYYKHQSDACLSVRLSEAQGLGYRHIVDLALLFRKHTIYFIGPVIWWF